MKEGETKEIVVIVQLQDDTHQAWLHKDSPSIKELRKSSRVHVHQDPLEFIRNYPLRVGKVAIEFITFMVLTEHGYLRTIRATDEDGMFRIATAHQYRSMRHLDLGQSIVARFLEAANVLAVRETELEHRIWSGGPFTSMTFTTSMVPTEMNFHPNILGRNPLSIFIPPNQYSNVLDGHPYISLLTSNAPVFLLGNPDEIHQMQVYYLGNEMLQETTRTGLGQHLVEMTPA
jgi:hypothetical protein